MVQERIGVPSALRRAIEEETKAQPAELLLRGASELGRNYRDPALGLSPKIVSDMQRLAYLVTRIPAIFQVNQTVDSELRHLCPDLAIASLLDLGCGPGTATLAAMQTFEQLNDATLVDRDAEWLKVGRRLIDSIDPHFAFRSRFAVVDLLAPSELGAHDLVVISYALGELSPSRTLAVVDWAWSLARRAIVMIEPGTPHGFATILAARDVLIGAGAVSWRPVPMPADALSRRVIGVTSTPGWSATNCIEGSSREPCPMRLKNSRISSRPGSQRRPDPRQPASYGIRSRRAAT